MDRKKQAILDALTKFMNQRSGIEFGNYGDVKAFRAEQRSIYNDLKQARVLLAAVKYADGITSDDLLKAAQGAYSGRLTLVPTHHAEGLRYRVDYCTGQYFPTEYRRAVCAVLASALWGYVREKCIPTPNGWRVRLWNEDGLEAKTLPKLMQIHEACETLNAAGGESKGYIQEFYNGKSQGDWLRAYFRKEFGRTIASRWFS